MGSSALDKIIVEEAKKQSAEVSQAQINRVLTRRVSQLEEDNKFFKLKIGELEDTIHQITNGK